MSVDKLKTEIIPTMLVILFSFSSLGKMYFEAGLLYQFSNYCMGLVGVISLLYMFIVRLNLKNVLIIFITFLLLLIPVMHNENLDLYQRFILPFLYLGIGLLLINFKLNYRLVSLSFILHAVLFIVHFPSGIGHSIFADTSRNYHSIIIIYNAILVYISLHQSNMKIKLYPAILTLLICLWSLGRSGILVSILFFLVVYYQKIKDGKPSTRHIKYMFSLIFGSILLYIFYISDDAFVYLDKFYDDGLLDAARSRLIEEYFYLMTSSAQNFVFGANTENNPLFYRYGYNLHNSYLRLHSVFGLPGVLTITFLLFNAARKYWKLNKHYLFLLGIILLRISTDQAAFFGIFDPLLIYFALNSFVTSKTNELKMKY